MHFIVGANRERYPAGARAFPVRPGRKVGAERLVLRVLVCAVRAGGMNGTLCNRFTSEAAWTRHRAYQDTEVGP